MLLSFQVLENFQRSGYYVLLVRETSLSIGKQILHHSERARENLLVNVEKENEIRREERRFSNGKRRSANSEKRTASESRKQDVEEEKRRE